MAEPTAIAASAAVETGAVAVRTATVTANAAIVTAKTAGRKPARIAAIVHLEMMRRGPMKLDATSPQSHRLMRSLRPILRADQNRRSRNLVNRNPPNRHSKPATLKPLTKAKVADAVVAVAVGVAVHAMGARVVRKEGQARRHLHRRANSVDQTKSKT